MIMDRTVIILFSLRLNYFWFCVSFFFLFHYMRRIKLTRGWRPMNESAYRIDPIKSNDFIEGIPLIHWWRQHHWWWQLTDDSGQTIKEPKIVMNRNTEWLVAMNEWYDNGMSLSVSFENWNLVNKWPLDLLLLNNDRSWHKGGWLYWFYSNW